MALILLGAAVLAHPASRSPVASILDRFVAEGKIPGAVVAIADRDRVRQIVASGSADLAARRPMRSDTLFWIASMTKAMTAAALLMLVDEGKVALDDPVAKYLPEFGNEGDKARFTVRDILRHTSGLPAFSPLEAPREDGTIPVLPLWLATRGYAMGPLESTPGTVWNYSNAGYATAGRIIETVSGVSFARFLQTRLFEPLGMRDTSFSPSRNGLGRLAKSYRPAPGGGFEETRIPMLEHPVRPVAHEPMPAGGLFSTAGDVSRFCGMMLGTGVFHGRHLLSEWAVGEATRNQVPEAAKVGYGFGWFTTPAGDYLHTGAHGTIMINYPGSDRALVILLDHATIQEGDPWTVYKPIIDAAFQIRS